MIRQCLFLFLTFLTFFVQAELQVWAYKGVVKIDGKQVEINQEIDENTRLNLDNDKSYVAFSNLESNKIIEVLGKKLFTYSQLKELENKLIKLPLIISEITNHKRSVYRGCRCLNSSINYTLYPKDKASFTITEEDFVFLWQKEETQNDEIDPTIYVMNLSDDILMKIPLRRDKNVIKMNFSNLIKNKNEITFFEQKNEFTLLIKMGNNSSKKITIIKDSFHVIFEQKEMLRKLKNTKSFAHKVYAMLWAYQQDLFIDGYLLFEELNNLSDYKGFDEYYQQLYLYYIKEEKK